MTTEQTEFEQLTGSVDYIEAYRRYKQNLARRWFAYYKKCQDEKKKNLLIKQYNMVARERS